MTTKANSKSDYNGSNSKTEMESNIGWLSMIDSEQRPDGRNGIKVSADLEDELGIWWKLKLSKD